MRLLAFHLRDEPPLDDLQLTFGQERFAGSLSELLDPAYAIHMVVGLNGSGKTRLLQALLQVLLTAERGDDRPARFPFPFLLVYTLSGEDSDFPDRVCYLRHRMRTADGEALPDRALVLRASESETTGPEPHRSVDWLAFPEREWEAAGERDRLFAGDSVEGAIGSGNLDAFLPSRILAYTSGAPSAWERVFFPEPDLSDEFEPEFGDEVPWTEGPGSTALTAGAGSLNTGRDRAYFLDGDALRLATFALALDRARRSHADAASGELTSEALGAPFERARWETTVSVGLRLTLGEEQLVQLIPRQARRLLALHELATFTRRDPAEGGGRLYVYDLSPDRADEPVAARLWGAIGGKEPTLFEVFRQLYAWRREGLLEGVTMALTKSDAPGVIGYDQLSDGERMVVGRLALIFLTHDTHDALVVLDEPETHFNDAWKRELVDVIHDALRKQVNEVVVSTHSSIALTDVFGEEIELVLRDDGNAYATDISLPTFGASPSEIMKRLFGARTGMGKRATEVLNALVLRDWTPDEADDLDRLIDDLVAGGFYRTQLRSIRRSLDDAPSD